VFPTREFYISLNVFFLYVGLHILFVLEVQNEVVTPYEHISISPVKAAATLPPIVEDNENDVNMNVLVCCYLLVFCKKLFQLFYQIYLQIYLFI
jgi:hypothetical protein